MRSTATKSHLEFLTARAYKHALTYVDCLALSVPLQRTFGPSFVFCIRLQRVGVEEASEKG